jgi:hypothetical protein
MTTASTPTDAEIKTFRTECAAVPNTGLAWLCTQWLVRRVPSALVRLTAIMNGEGDPGTPETTAALAAQRAQFAAADSAAGTFPGGTVTTTPGDPA